MMSTVTSEIPQHLMAAAHTTPDEVKVELAVRLYEQRRLSIGHARELAGMSLWQFRQLLASRQIAPDYGIEELDQDMQTWDPIDAS